MDTGAYALLGVLFGVAATCIAAVITGKFNLRITRANAEKEFQIQEKALAFERSRAKESLERERLESLHKILSKINRENSLATSYIQSDQNMEPREYHAVYDRNCSLVDEASVLADLYYPEFKDSIDVIVSEASKFWGNQQALLKIDIKKDPKSYKSRQAAIIEVAEKIRQVVDDVKREISKLAKELRQ